MTRTTESDATVDAADRAGAVERAAVERPDLGPLLHAYFRHVPVEDRPHRPADVIRIVEGHARAAAHRQPSEVKTRVFNPPMSPTDSGWSGAHTVIDVVNDDMPYLVDSVSAAVAASGVTVSRVLHPILAVRRDADGALTEVIGESLHGAHPAGSIRESWMHVLIDRLSDASKAEGIQDRIETVLARVRTVVADGGALTGAAVTVAADLREAPSPRTASEVNETADFLYWLVAGNLTFLGYRRYEPAADGEMQAVPGSGLGMLRDDSVGAAEPLSDDETAGHLELGQASFDSVLGRGQSPFAMAVRIFDPDGTVRTVHRIFGILTPRALKADINTIPVLRQVVQQLLAELGAAPDSYTGQRALDLLASYPRSELFWAKPEQVLAAISGVLQSTSTRRPKVFLQPDPHGRFVSVMVYLPRDRYTTGSRLAMQHALVNALGGSDIRYTAHIGDSFFAAVHFTVITDPANPVVVDQQALTATMRDAIRTWDDRLVAAVVGSDEDLDAAGVLSRYAAAFDEAYKEAYEVDHAVIDLERLDGLSDPKDLKLEISPSDVGGPGARRIKLYVTAGSVTLSKALPVLQNMGAEVIDERPYQVRRTDGSPGYIYDFGVHFPGEQFTGTADAAGLRRRFAAAFVAAWQGNSEVDGLNQLVLAAGLDWRMISVFRAYAKYLRQIGTPYSQGYVEQVLIANPTIIGNLAELFATQFDPDLIPGDEATRRGRCDDLATAVTAELDAVTSLDADRILRTLLKLITATDRTNFYRTDPQGQLRDTLSFKLDPHRVPGVPKPVPAHEVWVYSPRLEGVHLRFGAVARGGLRWSDRPDDFRTEILGLVKAQEVKNAVIVPVGAKGGFVLKRPPAPTGEPPADRDALQAEAIACYKRFNASLLDVTDNRVSHQVVAPEQVVRRDADDPYLVVAADKGTASFSDIANGVAADYNYWLDDAYASGGSEGFDHKDMGITAKGGWESVKHHFRELGVDTQAEDFTCVGIGDMSGDVFGNGMLLSEHIRLVAAFDHRHVFVDPDPDAARSFAERRRLFELPRSSWGNYETSLISEGGGVWPRSAKSIPVSSQIRDALGLTQDVTSLSPTELIRAVLLAPVDLLWNGGIGTYIKSSTESNVSVGDKSNDAVRVSGNELRVRVVGEGGNLGVTQLGRIEFARRGGKINTDAIDNSAGVDTSDHEVNIKIALSHRMAEGLMDEPARRELLAAMTDDVASLVLADNTAQNRVLGVSRAHAAPMLSVHARLIDALCASGRLDRELEFLPSRAQIDARINANTGLASPELAVLLAYVKASLTEAMVASELPDDPAYAQMLPEYFPSRMRELCAAEIQAHPLAREIVTTMTVNDLVNGAGISYIFRLEEEIAASATDAIRAYTVATKIFDIPAIWAAIAAQDNRAPAATQDTLLLDVRRLLDRAARWLLTNRPQPLDVLGEIDRYHSRVTQLVPQMPQLVCGVEQQNFRSDADRLVALGTPKDLAQRVAYSLYTFSLLDVVDVAEDSGRGVEECAALYYALSAHLDFDRTLTQVTNLARGDRWHALARQALRDDLYRSIRLITADVLRTTDAGQDAQSKIEQWERENASRLARARTTLGQVALAPAVDLAALSVAAREIRTMIR